jgi:hypothetical protein
VLVPVLENIMGWSSTRIREFFEEQGFALSQWEKVQTDSLTICPVPFTPPASVNEVA